MQIEDKRRAQTEAARKKSIDVRRDKRLQRLADELKASGWKVTKPEKTA